MRRSIQSTSHLSWLTLVALAISIEVGCNSTATPEPIQTSGQASDLPRVTTVKPKRGSLIQKTEQPGRIEAYSMTRIHAKVPGFVDQLLADIGDKVSGPKKDEDGKVIDPGMLLAVLVAPELTNELLEKQAMIAQAEADIEQAKAAVAVAESIAVSASANTAEGLANQKKAEADFQRWKSESERINTLAASKTVTNKLADETTQQLMSADASREEAVARIQAAKAKENETKVSISKSIADLHSTEAKLRIAKAEYQRVESLSEYLQIRAPYDGIISERNFDRGSLISTSQANDNSPLFIIVQSDRVRVILDVPESESLLVKTGLKATIKLPALSNRSVEGTVARTSWALRATTRTLECEIDVVNTEELLRPGMYANVELIVAAKEDVLTLPRTAILQREGKSTCLTVDKEGKVVRKSIVTGIYTPLEIEVVSGLDMEDDVISANAAAFKDGDRVTRGPK